MSPLVKGQNRGYFHTIIGGPNSVEKGGNMAVISKIICTSSIYRNCTCWHNFHFFFGNICDFHIFYFHVPRNCNKRCYFCLKTIFLWFSGNLLPHKTSFQCAFVLLICKFLKFLFCRISTDRPTAQKLRICSRQSSITCFCAFIYLTPEISGISVVMQVFNTYRLKKEMILIRFAVTSQIRGDTGFQSFFSRHRQIQTAIIFRIMYNKASVFILKFYMFHQCFSLSACVHPPGLLNFYDRYNSTSVSAVSLSCGI